MRVQPHRQEYRSLQKRVLRSVLRIVLPIGFQVPSHLWAGIVSGKAAMPPGGWDGVCGGSLLQSFLVQPVPVDPGPPQLPGARHRGTRAATSETARRDSSTSTKYIPVRPAVRFGASSESRRKAAAPSVADRGPLSTPTAKRLDLRRRKCD